MANFVRACLALVALAFVQPASAQDYPSRQVHLIVPFGGYWDGRINGLKLNDTFGAYDPILASTIWVLEQAQQGRYFAVTPLLYIPVGSYNTGFV